MYLSYQYLSMLKLYITLYELLHTRADTHCLHFYIFFYSKCFIYEKDIYLNILHEKINNLITLLKKYIIRLINACLSLHTSQYILSPTSQYSQVLFPTTVTLVHTFVTINKLCLVLCYQTLYKSFIFNVAQHTIIHVYVYKFIYMYISNFMHSSVIGYLVVLFFGCCCFYQYKQYRLIHPFLLAYVCKNFSQDYT